MVGKVPKYFILAAVSCYVAKSEPSCYDFLEKNIFLPIARNVPSERAHKWALLAVRLKIPPRADKFKPSILKTTVFGIEFDNPIGLAAGFDKDCEAIKGCQRLGFGFIEVGSITPEPQTGNAKPRVFRLPEDEAIINRYGFPSKGVDAAAKQLASLKGFITIKVDDSPAIKEKNLDTDDNIDNFDSPIAIANDIMENTPQQSSHKNGYERVYLGQFQSLFLLRLIEWLAPSTCKLGINLGINKNTKNPTNDYVIGVRKLGKFSNYIVINVSSPNTPGLRDLQRKDKLQKILLHVSSRMNRQHKATHGQACQALLLKISPDLSDDHLEEIVDLIKNPKYGVDGLIVSNTTMARPDSLDSSNKSQTGGLSGVPLKQISTDMIKKVYRMTNGTIPIVGVGGISTAEDAYEKIRAGASLVQLYTGLVYNGFGSIRHIKSGLCDLLERDGYNNVKDAVGADITISTNYEKYSECII